MKKMFTSCLLGVFLLSLSVSPGFGQTAEEIVQKMVKAMGGEKVFKSLNDTTMIGEVDFTQMGVSGTITVYKKEPNKRRVDIEVMGMLITQAYDGETAWWVNPQTGVTEEMPENEAANMKRESMPSVAILNPEKYGISFALKGKEQIDGKDHFVLEQTFSDGFTATIFLDNETYLATKSKGTTTTQMGEVEFEQIASDYKNVTGMMIPHMSTTYYNGAEFMSLSLTEVKFNTGLEDSLFKMEK